MTKPIGGLTAAGKRLTGKRPPLDHFRTKLVWLAAYCQRPSPIV
jgi:hypothetical protein